MSIELLIAFSLGLLDQNANQNVKWPPDTNGCDSQQTCTLQHADTQTVVTTPVNADAWLRLHRGPARLDFAKSHDGIISSLVSSSHRPLGRGGL